MPRSTRAIRIRERSTDREAASFYAFSPTQTNGVVLRSIGMADGTVKLEMTEEPPPGSGVPAAVPLTRTIDASDLFTPNPASDLQTPGM